MAIRVGCLKSDAPVFQGNEKRVVVQFADLAAWAKDAEKKELVGETRMGKWMECQKMVMVIQMQVFLLVYLCLFILFHESIQMSFGSGLMRKINAKSDVETVFVSQRDG